MKIFCLFLIINLNISYTPKAEWEFTEDIYHNETRKPQDNDSYNVMDHHNFDYL